MTLTYAQYLIIFGGGSIGLIIIALIETLRGGTQHESK